MGVDHDRLGLTLHPGVFAELSSLILHGIRATSVSWVTLWMSSHPLGAAVDSLCTLSLPRPGCNSLGTPNRSESGRRLAHTPRRRIGVSSAGGERHTLWAQSAAIPALNGSRALVPWLGAPILRPSPKLTSGQDCRTEGCSRSSDTLARAANTVPPYLPLRALPIENERNQAPSGFGRIVFEAALNKNPGEVPAGQDRAGENYFLTDNQRGGQTIACLCEAVHTLLTRKAP
jgi:hypothetical protein